MGKQMEIDMNGNPYWYIATSRVIGGNQSAAAMQATNTAKIDIAGQVQTKVTQLIESKVANDDMGQEEAASLSSAVAAGKVLSAEHWGALFLWWKYIERCLTKM